MSERVREEVGTTSGYPRTPCIPPHLATSHHAYPRSLEIEEARRDRGEVGKNRGEHLYYQACLPSSSSRTI